MKLVEHEFDRFKDLSFAHQKIVRLGPFFSAQFVRELCGFWNNGTSREWEFLTLITSLPPIPIPLTAQSRGGLFFSLGWNSLIFVPWKSRKSKKDRNNNLPKLEQTNFQIQTVMGIYQTFNGCWPAPPTTGRLPSTDSPWGWRGQEFWKKWKGRIYIYVYIYICSAIYTLFIYIYIYIHIYIHVEKRSL